MRGLDDEASGVRSLGARQWHSMKLYRICRRRRHTGIEGAPRLQVLHLEVQKLNYVILLRYYENLMILPWSPVEGYPFLLGCARGSTSLL